MARSKGASSAAARMIAPRKSWCARVSQSLTSSRSASSIQLSALVQDLMKQGGAQVFVAVHFAPRPHQHIGGHGQPAQAFLGALVAANRALVAARHNDHEVNVTVFSGRAPGVRAEQINFFRLKFVFQPFNGFVQKVRLNCLHGVKTSISVATSKARVTSTWQDAGVSQSGTSSAVDSFM